MNSNEISNMTLINNLLKEPNAFISNMCNLYYECEKNKRNIIDLVNDDDDANVVNLQISNCISLVNIQKYVLLEITLYLVSLITINNSIKLLQEYNITIKSEQQEENSETNPNVEELIGGGINTSTILKSFVFLFLILSLIGGNEISDLIAGPIQEYKVNIGFGTTLDTTLEYSLSSENNQYYGLIESASIDKIIAENYQYDGLYNYIDDTNIQSEYYQKEVNIDAGLGEPTILTEIDIYDLNTIVGQSDYETIGFGIYAEHGHAIRTYFDKNGRRVKERIKVDLIKEQKRRDIVKFKEVIGDKGDPRGGLILTSSVYYETKLNIQSFESASVINIGTSNIVEVTPLHGYLPTHYRNTSDLTKGLENSFFRGSKNTAATTLDGTPPVETFTSNPNTLKVNKAGRDASEPILEVD